MSENAGWLEHGDAAGSRPPEANPINAADKERIAHGNAEKLFGLQPNPRHCRA
jgi:hypothetical protein